MDYKNRFGSGFLGVALMIILSGILLGPTLLPSVQAATTNTLTVRAYSTNGEVLSMYTTIMSGGNTVKTGFTPLTYTGTTGNTYTVEVQNYRDLAFDKWATGSTSSTRDVTLWGDTTAVAYYNTGSTSTSTTTTSSSSSSSSSSNSLIPKTGVIVSLYMYPGSTGSAHWQKVIDEKNKHPSVPIVAIFNPSSGPGSSKDSNIANWVSKLQNSGVIAIGYVADKYGSKSLSTLKSDVDKYSNWYKADGLFIDEFTNKPGYESRYSELTSYAKSNGMKLTVGNPGTDVPPSYIGKVDVINTSEGSGYISTTDPNVIGSSWVSGGYSGWHKDYDKSNFSIIRYNIGWIDGSFVSEVSKVKGLIYITNGNDSDGRWMHVPSFFGDLVSRLN